jgi:hypothetical protein
LKEEVKETQAAELKKSFGPWGCVDPVTGASDEPFALVDLGRCNVRTAERLANVLKAMSGGEELRVKVRQVNRERRSR